MMYCYWAEFVKLGKDVFRYDTRIYLGPIDEIDEKDFCIGAVVGKNPGSAKSVDTRNEIQPIKLDGDKLLPTVRSIVQKAYKEAGIQPAQRGYIQVLNLFYLCEANLEKAILAMKENQNAHNCNTENQSFPWLWYVWGGKSERLTPYKARFSSLIVDNHFYYDKEKSEVVSDRPSESGFAKHTQGLRHEEIVPYIAKIIKKESSL